MSWLSEHSVLDHSLLYKKIKLFFWFSSLSMYMYQMLGQNFFSTRENDTTTVSLGGETYKEKTASSFYRFFPCASRISLKTGLSGK